MCRCPTIRSSAGARPSATRAASSTRSSTCCTSPTKSSAARRQHQPRHQRRRARRLQRRLAMARRLPRHAGPGDLHRRGQRRSGEGRNRGRPRLDHGAHPLAGASAVARARGRARVDGRWRRHRGPIRERARDLVRRQDRFAVRVKPPGRRLDQGQPARVRREPSIAERHNRLDLQRAVSPDQRRQLHRRSTSRRISIPAAFVASRPACGKSDSSATKFAMADSTPGSSATIRRSSSRSSGRRLFRFPSFFTERSHTDSHSISSLACGHRVIAVSNLDDARQRINASSSQGPTRDGRYKPEIAAPAPRSSRPTASRIPTSPGSR